MPEEQKTAESKPAKPSMLEKVKELSLPAAVLALDVTPDGKTIFAACQDGGVFTVELESGKPELLGRHPSYASGVSFLPDSNTVISAGYDGGLQWHDLAARKTV